MTSSFTCARWCWPALAVILLLIVANHVEHHLRPRPPAGAGPVVRAEDGPGGHTTIALREDATGDALTFARLGTWDYQPGSTAPAEVARLDGTSATITGFMYPLAAGERLSTFCLLRSTQTCCFGPRPQFTQYLLVETTAPVALERFAPVTVSGVFRLDPQPAQGYIYRLEQATVVATAPQGPDPDAWAASHGQTRWRWPLLDQPALVAEPPTLPTDLAAVDGQPAVVDGFIHHRGPEGLLVAAQPPGTGPAPGLRQALSVHLAKDLPIPEGPSGAWQGTLRVTRDPQAWPDVGVVRLEDARPLPPRLLVEDDRWLLPPSVEILLVLAVLALGIRRRAATALLLLVATALPSEETLLATVGTHRITLAEVNRGIPKDLFGPLRQEAKARRLDRLVQNAKATSVYEGLGPLPTDAALEVAYREFRALPLAISCGCHTAATYEEYLTQSALTDEDVRTSLRLDLAEKDALERSWATQHPGAAGRQALLQAQGAEVRANFIHLWQIPFYAAYQEAMTDDPATSACGRRAVAARKKLEQGVPFATVALEAGGFESPDRTAGDAGVVGRTDPIATNAATGTPPPVAPGVLSPPRRTPFGFVLLRWEELTDDEVLARLRSLADWDRRKELGRTIEAVPVTWTAAGRAILPPRPGAGP